jgi:hypothetical protein
MDERGAFREDNFEKLRASMGDAAAARDAGADASTSGRGGGFENGGRGGRGGRGRCTALLSAAQGLCSAAEPLLPWLSFCRPCRACTWLHVKPLQGFETLAGNYAIQEAATAGETMGIWKKRLKWVGGLRCTGRRLTKRAGKYLTGAAAGAAGAGPRARRAAGTRARTSRRSSR